VTGIGKIAKIAVIAKIERQLRFDSKRFIEVSQTRLQQLHNSVTTRMFIGGNELFAIGS
jgi:hypothetical protein